MAQRRVQELQYAGPLLCGYGGNDNGTTRFREYHGEYYGVDDAKIKPILKEYTDAAHLLKPNHWYEVKIRVENGATTYAHGW